jgi:hypothetical protein
MAQSPDTSEVKPGRALSAQAGWGYVAVRDEYLSSEKYSTFLPSIGGSWTDFRPTWEYALNVLYQSTKNLKNNNVSAELNQFSIRLDIFFPVGDFFWIGPGSEVFVHMRRQHIAGDFKSSATLGMFSANINAAARCPLGSSLRAEAKAFASLFSLAGKSSESNEPSRIFGFPSALRTAGEIRLRFELSESVSASLGYHFEATRVTAWDYFILGTDQTMVVFSYQFSPAL